MLSLTKAAGDIYILKIMPCCVYAGREGVPGYLTGLIVQEMYRSQIDGI
jgi:hypothetical protein